MDDFLDEMTVEQYQEWLDYFDIEPRGDERADWHAAQIVAQIASWGGSKGVKVSKCLLPFGREQERRDEGRIDLTQGDGWLMFKAAMQAREAKVKRPNVRDSANLAQPRPGDSTPPQGDRQGESGPSSDGKAQG